MNYRDLILYAAAATLAFATFRSAGAADFAWELKCEMQYADAELPDLTWSQGTTPLIAARTFERGKAVPPRGDVTVQMMIAPSATSLYWAVVTNQATNSTSYLLQWPTIGTNTTASAPWYYVVYFLRDGHRYWTGSGDLWIEETTATGDGLHWQEIATPDIAELSNRVAVVEGAVDGVRQDLDDISFDIYGTGGITNRLENVEAEVADIADAYLPKAWTNEGALAQLQLGEGTYDRLEGWLSATPWLTPARFAWEVEWGSGSVVTESNQALGPYSFAIKVVTVERLQQATLRPDIVRNQWDADFEAVVDGPATLAEQGDGSYLLSWLLGTEPGSVASVSGHLGDWVETAVITMPAPGRVDTEQRFLAFADDAVGVALDGVRAAWQALPGTRSRFLNYSASKGKTPETLELVPNPDFWARDCDLSGVSVWNDSGWYYTKPCTLVSSNVAIGAAHWSLPVGSTVAFFGKDGALHFSRIVAQRKVAYDLAFSLLAPAIPEEVATAYPILQCEAASRATLPPPGRVFGVPQPPVLSCAQSGTAWLMAGGQSGHPFDSSGNISGPATFYLSGYWDGETWGPHSRGQMVGGDSGHPQFVSTDGTNLVLVGCAYTTKACSYPGNVPATVEAAVQSLGGAPVLWETWPDWPKYDGMPKP